MTCKTITTNKTQCTRYARSDGYCDMHHPGELERRKRKREQQKLADAHREIRKEIGIVGNMIIGMRNTIVDRILAGNIEGAVVAGQELRTLLGREQEAIATKHELGVRLGWEKES